MSADIYDGQCDTESQDFGSGLRLNGSGHQAKKNPDPTDGFTATYFFLSQYSLIITSLHMLFMVLILNGSSNYFARLSSKT